MKTKILLLLMLAPFIGSARTKIPADHPGIHIHGAKFIQKIDSVLHIERFPDSLLSFNKTKLKFNPVKARTNTGVLLSFKTNSPEIKAKFRLVTGENRGSVFGIFQDGEFTGSVKFSRNDGPILSFKIKPKSLNIETVYEITLPIWANVEFVGLEIADTYYLVSDYIPVDKKIYVAYGNSITHGTGQSATFETYPFLLSRMLNWELYNLAVGGAKTSQSIAEMIRDKFSHIDFMTVLIGYNDYNNEGITAEDYYYRLGMFLRTVREKHPTTKIFCITQTYTTQTKSKVTGISINQFRQKVVDIVSELQTNGDSNIYLIQGECITSQINLKDAVHFSVNGAKLFADSLYKYISAFTIKNSMKEINSSPQKYDTEFRIFPNPGDGILYFEFNSGFDQIDVFNVLGQEIRSISVSKNFINLNNLPSGIYYLLCKKMNKPQSISKYIKH